MSLVPILANGFCAEPSAQQLRSRVLHSTSMNLTCCGVKTQVKDGKGCGLVVNVVQCLEKPETLRAILGEKATLSDVRSYLAEKALKQVGILHNKKVAAHSTVVFRESSLDSLLDEFQDTVHFPDKPDPPGSPLRPIDQMQLSA